MGFFKEKYAKGKLAVKKGIEVKKAEFKENREFEKTIRSEAREEQKKVYKIERKKVLLSQARSRAKESAKGGSGFFASIKKAAPAPQPATRVVTTRRKVKGKMKTIKRTVPVKATRPTLNLTSLDTVAPNIFGSNEKKKPKSFLDL